MKPSRIPTIRSRLVLLVMTCVIPASLMAVVLIFYNYQREQVRLVRDSIATTRAMVHAIDSELSSIALAAEVLSTFPHLQSGDIPAFYAHAHSVEHVLTGNNIVLSDITGQQLLNTLKPLGEQLPRHGNPEQLRKVFETGRTVVSDVYIGGVLQRPVISIDVPVIRDGKVTYDLSIGIRPEHFFKLLSDQRLPPGWIGAVLDSTGAIVARTHEMGRFIGKKASPALVQRMTEVAEDSLESTTLEGIPVLTVFSRSAVSNWTVAIGIPTQDLTRRLRRLLWSLVLGATFLLMGSLAVAWVIGSRISRSMRDLTGPALALGSGESVTIPPLHLKEADDVGQALLKASGMLHDAQHRAHHDALTGLGNRALFNEIVDQQLAICKRTDAPLAVLYVDLDGFKAVNDAHGHAAGDELLRAVAARIKSGIRSSDVAFRLGGDEFAVVLIQTGVEESATLAGKLADSVSIPYSIGQLTLEISASIGIAGYPDSGTTSDALLRSADEAMYKIKSDRNRQNAAGRAARVVGAQQ